MNPRIEIDREVDGRWIADVPDLPGVMVYGESERDAVSKVTALARRVIADRAAHGEQTVPVAPLPNGPAAA